MLSPFAGPMLPAGLVGDSHPISEYINTEKLPIARKARVGRVPQKSEPAAEAASLVPQCGFETDSPALY